jgi:hypothetical protein
VTDATAHDAHQLAHANDIRRRFASQHVTTGQIVMFGLTGGLIPCPAAITVLLLCLQLRQVTLGVALVLCFSIGLALTMVISGVVAALSVQHVARRWSGFGAIAAQAPYLSSALIICVGLYVGWQGVHALAAAERSKTGRTSPAGGTQIHCHGIIAAWHAELDFIARQPNLVASIENRGPQNAQLVVLDAPRSCRRMPQVIDDQPTTVRISGSNGRRR